MKKQLLLLISIFCLLLAGASPGFAAWGLGSWGEGGNGTTADAPFGTDNVLIRSDGTGRKSQATGVTVSDSDVFTMTNNFDIQTAGTINLRPSGDIDDYPRFSTIADVPTISTIGSCDLALTPTANLELNPTGYNYLRKTTVLDDNDGASPSLTFLNESENQCSLSLIADGTMSLVIGTGGIQLAVNGDFDDYFTFQTISNVPTIATVGACDLDITSTANSELIPINATISRKNMMFDDGSGNSPAIQLFAEDFSMFQITKLDAGQGASLLSEDEIWFLASSDFDDFLTLSTVFLCAS